MGLRIMADRIARSTPPEGVDHLCLRVGEQVRSSRPRGLTCTAVVTAGSAVGLPRPRGLTERRSGSILFMVSYA